MQSACVKARLYIAHSIIIEVLDAPDNPTAAGGQVDVVQGAEIERNVVASAKVASVQRVEARVAFRMAVELADAKAALDVRLRRARWAVREDDIIAGLPQEELPGVACQCQAPAAEAADKHIHCASASLQLESASDSDADNTVADIERGE